MIRGERKIYGLLCLMALVLMISTAFTNNDLTDIEIAKAKSISSMTYNIRFDDIEGGKYDWEARKSLISQTISNASPDIVGLQSGYYNQIKWLEKDLKVYDWYAVGSDDGEFRGEYCAIMYDKRKFSRLDKGTIWMSDNIDVPGSQCWGAGEPAVITWVQLSNRLTNDILYVFNTRFPNISLAKEKGTKLLIDKVKKITGGSTFIITGDFASAPDDENIQELAGFCKEAQQSAFLRTATVNYTYVSEVNGKDVKSLRDYVFFSNDVPVNSYEVVDNVSKGAYPSDHLPVICKLRFP